jgi:hypothetical protein
VAAGATGGIFSPTSIDLGLRKRTGCRLGGGDRYTQTRRGNNCADCCGDFCTAHYAVRFLFRMMSRHIDPIVVSEFALL